MRYMERMMSKKPKSGEKTTEAPTQKQEKLADALSAGQTRTTGEFQPHNARKEPLGPNTKR